MEPIEPEKNVKQEEPAAFGYNADAVRPFLGRPSARPNRFFRGEAAFPGTLAQEDRNYYYHATTLGNLPGILEQGLDPGRGGRGGAGALIAAPVDAQAGAYFENRDAGFVYLADDVDTAVRYAFQYDDQADGFGQPPAIGRGNIQRSAVMLRIRRDNLERGLLERDHAESGAVRTTERLIPSNLEVLTEGGWSPLRDRELRQEIYNNVNDILGREDPNRPLPEDENDVREREDREEIGRNEVREAEPAGQNREETSLEELRGEEGPRRESRITPPSQSKDKSNDKSAGL